jgi:hypothetical protein
VVEVEVESYWEVIRPRRLPTERVEQPGVIRGPLPHTVDPQATIPPTQQTGRVPYGVIDRHNRDGELSTSLRQTLQARALEGIEAATLHESESIRRQEHRRIPNTWAEFEPLNEREQRIRNHAFMDGLSIREEPDGNGTLTRLMTSLAALGITGSVSQERLPNGNRAVIIIMEPVLNEEPHFNLTVNLTNRGGIEVVAQFPEDSTDPSTQGGRVR